VVVFIGAFFGILIPFMTSVQTSIMIIVTWLVSAPTFISLMKQSLSTYSMSLVLVLLYMLVYDTEKILGPYFSFMTSMIIVLFAGLSYMS